MNVDRGVRFHQISIYNRYLYLCLHDWKLHCPIAHIVRTMKSDSDGGCCDLVVEINSRRLVSW